MLQSLGKSLQGELNNMIQSMETHRKEVDRVAGVEHMNATNELKLGPQSPLPVHGRVD